jgi:DeoR/GlpR family transcriptional regulator of sugar metabolism
MQAKPQVPDDFDPALPQERRQALLAQLSLEGRIVCSTLAQKWDVSEDTIRRDIRHLDDAGLLRRVHGGALPRSPQATPYHDRADTNVTDKSRLGAHGALAITDGMTALLYGGTTILEAARHLRADLRARVITNDPRIGLEVAGRQGVEPILVGGRVLRSSQLIVGSQAVDDVRAIRADICLIGACSLHDQFGLGINDVEEAALQRAFVAAACEVVALVTADKLQTVAPFRVTSAAAITRLITTVDANPQILERFANLGLHIDSV